VCFYDLIAARWPVVLPPSLSPQALVEHVFPVSLGLVELVALVSELSVTRRIVAAALGESVAQLHGLVRIAEARFVHAGAVMMPQAHQGGLGNGKVIDVLNFEILAAVLVDAGSVEEATGHIAVISFAELEQLPLGLADLFIVSFAAGEVALVFELLQTGHVGSVGVVEALVGLDARDAPVVMVVMAVTSVTSMTSASVTSVMVSVVMSAMTSVASVTSVAVTSMTAVTSVMVVGVIVAVVGRSGLRR